MITILVGAGSTGRTEAADVCPFTTADVPPGNNDIVVPDTVTGAPPGTSVCEAITIGVLVGRIVVDAGGAGRTEAGEVWPLIMADEPPGNSDIVVPETVTGAPPAMRVWELMVREVRGAGGILVVGGVEEDSGGVEVTGAGGFCGFEGEGSLAGGLGLVPGAGSFVDGDVEGCGAGLVAGGSGDVVVGEGSTTGGSGDVDGTGSLTGGSGCCVVVVEAAGGSGLTVDCSTGSSVVVGSGIAVVDVGPG